MQYRLYTTSHTAWSGMLKAIKSAQRSIYLEMYIFLDDTHESHDFMGTLKLKAAQGLQIILVADAFGSKSLRKSTIEELRAAGIELLFFSHWLRHIHRKLLIVDEQTAFLGGVNIGKRFHYWNDLMLRLDGLIVKKLLRSFAYTYAMANGHNLKILSWREKKLAAKLRFWLIEHSPIKNIYTLRDHYVEKISTAEHKIQIVTPYFTPPRWLISLLDQAVRRGVKVEILLPAEVDWKIMNSLNYRYMTALHPLGIDFFLTKRMNHAKLLLIDERSGLLGSQNVDLLSFNLNTELGLFFEDKKLIQELSTTINRWKKGAQTFEPKRRKLRLLDILVMALMKLLRPIL